MKHLFKYLGTATLTDFVNNRWFLGITAAVIVISILRKSRFLSVAYFSLLVLGILIGHTIPMEGPATINMGILVFGVGVLVVVGLSVYFLVIKDG